MVHDKPRRDGTEKQKVGLRSSHKSSCVFFSKLERRGDNQYADMVSNGEEDLVLVQPYECIRRDPVGSQMGLRSD